MHLQKSLFLTVLIATELIFALKIYTRLFPNIYLTDKKIGVEISTLYYILTCLLLKERGLHNWSKRFLYNQNVKKCSTGKETMLMKQEIFSKLSKSAALTFMCISLYSATVVSLV